MTHMIIRQFLNLEEFLTLIGTNSAEGVASINSCKAGKSNAFKHQPINRRRSTLDIEPIGLSFTQVSPVV
jgi:hypothetical protein